LFISWFAEQEPTVARLMMCFVLCANVAISSQVALAQSEPSRTPEQLVADLGSPSFSKREKASEALWKLGEAARPALEAALKSDKEEVVRRAKQILEKFDSGNLPDISPESKTMIDRFRSSTGRARIESIRPFCHVDAGPTLLRRLMQKEFKEQDEVLGFHVGLFSVLQEEVPLLIVEGHLQRAEALLELQTYEPNSPGLMDYAIFCSQTGRGKAAAEKLEARSKTPGMAGFAAKATLVFLYRAMGEFEKAREQAKLMEKSDLRFRRIHDSLLEDGQKWALLAERQSNDLVNSRAGMQIYHLRMAGRKTEADKLADELKDAELGERDRAGAVDSATLALLLNNRSLDGIERLKQQLNAPHILADVLSSRLMFKDALDLVSNNTKGDDASGLDRVFLRQLYGTRKGRLLWQLGQRDASTQVFNKMAEEITGGPENRDGRPYPEFAITQLVRTEVRSGRPELACEHLATALAVSGMDGTRPSHQGQDPFELIFDVDADVAEYWWRVLRKNRPDGETAAATMKKIRRLLLGQATEQERKFAFEQGKKDAGQQRRNPVRDGRRDEIDTLRQESVHIKPMAIATLYRASGDNAEAIRVLTAHADAWPKKDLEITDPGEAWLNSLTTSSRSWIFGIDEEFRYWIELGDLLLEQGQPQEAARRYFQGWKLHANNGLLLYLSGRALLKAGDEAEGKKRIEASHLVSMGNARVRGRFLEELITRGFSADVRREINLIRLCAWVSDLYIGNVWNQVARGSILLKDFETAAVAHNRAIYYLLRTPGVSYVEGYAYLTVPQAVRVATARHLISTGKIPEGMELAKDCFTIMPGNTDLALGVIPSLDKQGKKKEADELFRIVWTAYGSILKDNPESAWARSQAAWLAAGCQRELDQAMEFAKKAVELEPNVRSFQETLAEVSFRKGDRDTAVSLMKKLISLDRRNFHYRRQLDRYQSAPFDSPLPDTDED
jgi:tetratricopeptide (TPR) repeat protein